MKQAETTAPASLLPNSSAQTAPFSPFIFFLSQKISKFSPDSINYFLHVNELPKIKYSTLKIMDQQPILCLFAYPTPM